MKKFTSIILCLLLCLNLFSAVSFGAEYKWVTKLDQKFTNFDPNSAFEQLEDGDGKWYLGSGSSSNVTNQITAYNDNNAWEIKRTGSGERDVYYKFNTPLSGKTEIKLSLLSSKDDPCRAVDITVFGSDEDGNLDTNSVITGSQQYYNNKIYTKYNGNISAGQNTITSWPKEKWLNITYTIDTTTGETTVTYSGAFAVTRTITNGVVPLADIAGFCVKTGESNAFSLYVDDIEVQHYEADIVPVDKQFLFSYVSDENVNAVTTDLDLVSQFTDSENNLWYVTWVSGDDSVIDISNGKISRGALDQRVKLTAILTNSGNSGETEVSVTKVFNVNVLAEGTYYVNESFDSEGDYTSLNAIATYVGKDGETWGVGSNYGVRDTHTLTYMNANVGTDPTDVTDKVLAFNRTSTTSQPLVQRVWTRINDEASLLNKKVYASMRVYRDVTSTPTYVYGYNANDERLFYFEFMTAGSIKFRYGSGLTTVNTVNASVPQGKWFDMTIEMDMEKSCYNVYIDGNLVTDTSLSFGDVTEKAGFGGLMLDLTRDVYTENSRVYFDNLTVRTTDNNVYSVMGYNFVSSDGYATHSMEQGGKLKSVNLRKMSQTDEDARLFACYYKGGNLSKVYVSDIDKDIPIGSFEHELNVNTPDNPLEYTLKVFIWGKNSLAPVMQPTEYTPFRVNPTVYVAGDSLAKSYAAKDYPQTGYAQVLNEFFTDNITVSNHAEGGRSSKSFIDEGRLDSIFSKMRSGDYLLIQFGHNDDKEDEARRTDPYGDKNTEGSYKYYLMKYIDGARERGAMPILLTPPARGYFNEEGKLHDANLIKYVEAMRALAKDENVAIIDLYADWKTFVDNTPDTIEPENFYINIYPNDTRFVNDANFSLSKYTADASDKTVFTHYYDNDTSNVIHADSTHLNAYSARVAAQMIAKALKDMNIVVSEEIINEETPVTWPWNGYETFGETLYVR